MRENCTSGSVEGAAGNRRPYSDHRARVAKAQAGIRSLSSAVTAYSAHTSGFPPTLDPLTALAANAQGLTAGPFVGVVPTPPQGWSAAYAYATAVTGTFTISAAGDNTTVSGP